MTNRDQLEYNIIEYIKNTITLEIFHNLTYFSELYDYNDLNYYRDLELKEFIKHNTYCLHHIDYSQLLMISLMIDNIKNDFIYINNSENYIESKIMIIYFNYYKNLIITYKVRHTSED
jgi:hypothetical protein